MSKTASERSMLQVGRVMRYVSSIVGRQSRFLVLLMMAGLISIAKPVFLTPDNVLNLLRQASLIFVLGAGQTLVILTTGIDLSMSSVAALSGVIMATLLHAGQPVVLSIVVGLAIGAVMGLINGLLITRVGLPPFVATFGMWMVGKGLTVWYIDGEVIWGFPQSFRVLGASRIGPVPSIIIIGLLVFLIFHGRLSVVLVLALTHPLTDGQYWINLPKSEGLPFMGLVEHTNYVSSTHYGGDHLVYCGDYLPPDHPYLDCDKETLLETYLPGLERINPAFRREWVRACWMFSERYAQPVPFVHHSRHIPPLATPLPGLWMANMSQVYPWDRGTNYAVELGRRVAREVSQSDGAELFPNRKPA